MHHNAHIEANQPLYTMHSLLIFDIFMNNLRVSRIVYSRLKTKIASLWSATADGKLETCSATFHSVKLV